MRDFPGPLESYQAHAAAIDDGVRRVLDSGWYILGSEVEAFEGEFAAYVGREAGVGVASGTEALVLALRSLGVGRGDLVATVALTAVATVAAVEMVGATPLLVDVEPGTMTMDAASLERSIEKLGRPAAVIPVHLYGQPADMPAILEVARRHGCFVIEDCAQAHGAALHGQRVGTWGEVGAFSCYPTKNLGALGDAGVLVCDERVAAQARVLRQYGWRERYVSDLPGINSRLDPLQAAVLRAKLPSLDAENARRREIAARYDTALAGVVSIPSVRPGGEHVYHQYTVTTPDREALRRTLAATGVPSAVLYPVPVHRQPAYAGRVPTDPEGLPATETITAELLCLPMHPQLRDETVDRVCDAVQGWRHVA